MKIGISSPWPVYRTFHGWCGVRRSVLCYQYSSVVLRGILRPQAGSAEATTIKPVLLHTAATRLVANAQCGSKDMRTVGATCCKVA
eukprot:6192490-Pleurochrysis_carterae.AAC.4